MKLYLNELPSYTPAKPTRPNPIVNSSDEEIREALLMGPEAVAEWDKKRAQSLIEIERQRKQRRTALPHRPQRRRERRCISSTASSRLQLVQRQPC